MTMPFGRSRAQDMHHSFLQVENDTWMDKDVLDEFLKNSGMSLEDLRDEVDKILTLLSLVVKQWGWEYDLESQRHGSPLPVQGHILWKREKGNKGSTWDTCRGECTLTEPMGGRWQAVGYAGWPTVDFKSYGVWKQREHREGFVKLTPLDGQKGFNDALLRRGISWMRAAQELMNEILPRTSQSHDETGEFVL